jgi:acyl carrier protein
MNDFDTRLQHCFAAIFPDVSPDSLVTATMDSIEEWDSVALVTLVNVVEQEFGLQVDMEDFPRFTSFAAVLEYLRTARSTT